MGTAAPGRSGIDRAGPPGRSNRERAGHSAPLAASLRSAGASAHRIKPDFAGLRG
jgi:hypothetical protein